VRVRDRPISQRSPRSLGLDELRADMYGEAAEFVAKNLALACAPSKPASGTCTHASSPLAASRGKIKVWSFHHRF
jgi:hypothetical protein